PPNAGPRAGWPGKDGDSTHPGAGPRAR
ncbi:MAG: hypothetical protein QOC85_2448, partial [Streptomyces sp.]|nr:hypothetical protein [Streptomyces sp.]